MECGDKIIDDKEQFKESDRQGECLCSDVDYHFANGKRRRCPG